MFNLKRVGKFKTLPLFLSLLLLITSVPLFPLDSSATNNCGYTDPEPYGVNVCNAKGYQLNYDLWKDTGILAYGKFDDITSKKNDFKKGHQPLGTTNIKENVGYYREGQGFVGSKEEGKFNGNGEYRYHGFDYNGVPYANPYFPNDSNSLVNTDATRRWIFEPWDNGLVAEAPRAPLAGGDDGDYYLRYLNEKLVDGQGIAFTNAIKLPNTAANNQDPTNYFYTYHVPNIRTAGSGIMWHKSAENGRIYYKTYHMPTVGERNLTPVEAEIVVLDEEPIKRGNYNGDGLIPVRVKVIATLKDENYYGNPANEFAFYTRADIESWTISIGNVGHGNVQEQIKIEPVKNTGTAQFTLLVPADKIDQVTQKYLATAKATAHYFKSGQSAANTSKHIQFSGESVEVLSLFTIRNTIDFIGKSNFSADIVNYKDASLGEINRYDITITNTDSGESKLLAYTTGELNDSTVQTELHNFMQSYFSSETVLLKKQKDFIVEQTIMIKNGKTATHTETVVVSQHNENAPPTPPGMEPPIVEEPKYVNPNLSVPKDGFDIVGVSISDNTDMTDVAERYCSVDGVSVSENDLFSGNYIFGIGNHGFHSVRCDYVSTDGLEASQVKWIKIWDTKPRAQYKTFGPYKENRKMIIDDDSLVANDQFVTDSYPINNFNWNFTTVEGDPLKFKTDTNIKKEFLSNTPGIYEATLTVTNTLGRVSDPYTVRFRIVEDIPPSVILHPHDGQIGRGEKIRIMYDAVSADGDQVGTQKVEVFYDNNNDGNYNQLIQTINPSSGLTEYTPPNKVGKYKLVATVEEVFGEETILTLLDGTEKRTRVVETWFEVDNYQPTSAAYVDIPIVLPQIDSFFMVDKNLAQSKIDYVKNNKVTINNMMRDEYMNPSIDTWDMKTYTLSTSASKTRNTGSSYPSSSTYYSSGGYSGTLYRYDVRNDKYWVDQGSYKTKTESKTASASASQSGTNKCGTTTSPAYSTTAGRSYSDSAGYSGYLSLSYSYSSPGCTIDNGDGTTSYSWSRSWYWSGTVTRSVTYWDSNWVQYNDYTGYYSGTIYKDIRQAYDNSFFRTTSDKYVVYISDSNVNELWDLQMAMNNNDAKLILVGQTGMKSQITHDHFILNNKPIEDLMKDVVQYISDSNPAIPKYYTLINEPFNLHFAQYDDENDPTVADQTMYVQDANYFDNSLGKSNFAVSTYGESAWTNATKINSFDKVGKYTINRRIKDQPSSDPAFANYSYYSNVAKIDVFTHRRPIAAATLDWDYDSNRNVYYTTWVDDSYDLDHEFSHPEKGIVDRKVKYKLNSSPSWIYKIPDELDPGSYTLEYVVKDVEGVWSFPFVQSFTLQPAPPVQLNAKARTVDTTYTLNSVPASERLSMYEIWTRYPYSHYLSVRLFQGGTARTSETRVNYHTGTKSGNDINWNNITHTIPSTMQDGNYTYRITAVGQGGNTATINFPLTVNTPINLVPNFPNEVTVGDTYATRAITSKYVNMTRVTFWKGTAYQTTIDLTGTTSGYNKNWTRNYTIPSMPDGNYIVEYQSTTPNGKVETRQLTVKVVNNRPPVAGFELYANNYNRQVPPRSVFEGDTLLVNSTAFDPDPNDYMTWRYDLTYPDGTTDVFTEENPSFKVLQIGTHRLVQTVTDSYGKSDSVTQTIVVGLLEITGQVSHTDNWLEIHKTQGNNPYVEFYSGEKFMLEADVTVHDIESVRVYFEGEQVNGGTLNLTTDLSQVGPQSKIWNGSLSDNRMVEAKIRLSDGMVQFTFVVSYTNGIEKSDEIYVEIIGSVYDPLNYHRSN